MTKLYQKLIKSCPSESEIKKGLKKVSEMSSSPPDKHLLMKLLNMIDLTSLNTTDNRSHIIHLTGKVNSFSGRFSNIPNVAAVADEISEMKEAARDKILKVIIESGLLGNYENIFKASMIVMDAGADFIKTSSGKTSISATHETAFVMCRAISNFYSETGIKVGFKAAGGIVTTSDAINYYHIVNHCLGEEWLEKTLFRLGASRLANNILTDISGKESDYF